MIRAALIPLCALIALAPAGCGGEDKTTTAAEEPAPTGADSEPRVYFGFIKAADAAPEGAEVRAVEKSSPIAFAGLGRGDVIVEIDGEPVADAGAAAAALEEISFEASAGETVEVEVERGSKPKTLEVLLAPNVLLGAQVEDVKEKESGEFFLQVRAVEPGTGADEAGLKPDDLIVAIDGEPVEETRDLFAGLGEHVAGDEVELTLLRDGKERTVAVTVSDRTRAPEPPG
jgi:S1-C subfamily serine protease